MQPKWNSLYEDFLWEKDSLEMEIGITAGTQLNELSWEMMLIFDPMYWGAIDE